MQTIISAISLLIGFSFILWGKDIFKIYICFMGIVIGAGLGAGLGLVTEGSTSAAAVGVVLFGALFGSMALVLHKIFVFIIAGFMGGMLSVLILAATGLTGRPLAALGIIAFFAAGSFALKYYNHILVIIMGLTGAELIYGAFQMIYLKRSYPRLDFSGCLEALPLVLNNYWLTYLYVLLLLVFFAYYFQVRMNVRKEDDLNVKAEKLIFSRITYLFASLAIINAIAFYFMKQEAGKFVNDMLISSHLSFGFLAITTVWFIKHIIPRFEKLSFTSGIKLKRFIALGILALAILPLVGGILWGIYVMTGKYTATFFEVLVSDFKNFFHKELIIAVSKWIFHLLILPWLIYNIVFDTGFNLEKLEGSFTKKPSEVQTEA